MHGFFINGRFVPGLYCQFRSVLSLVAARNAAHLRALSSLFVLQLWAHTWHVLG